MIYVALIGATLIIVRGTIFAWLQKLWPPFFRCAQCTGFWVGAAAGASGVVTTGHGRALDAFLVGSTTSVLSLLTQMVLLKLDD